MPLKELAVNAVSVIDRSFLSVIKDFQAARLTKLILNNLFEIKASELASIVLTFPEISDLVLYSDRYDVHQWRGQGSFVRFCWFSVVRF